MGGERLSICKAQILVVVVVVDKAGLDTVADDGRGGYGWRLRRDV